MDDHKHIQSAQSSDIGVIEDGQQTTDDGVAPKHGIKRDLRRRHINMISIAGMIGTGLFLASGQAIALAGPLGALLGYIVMGLITCGVALSTGELSAFLPVTGGFVRHASHFVQPALGTATGWNFWYTLSITAPAELTACAAIINFWNPNVNPAVWYSVFIVIIAILNFAGVRWYGESEVVFAALKITLIIALIVAGLVVDLGGGPDGDRIGFRYWDDPGPFNTYLVESDENTGRFLAFWSTLLIASYSYANVQIVALAGAETRSPRTIIPNAVKMTFWRVAIFYILSLFIVGLLVPYNDPNLGISTGDAQQSPFVIAFERAGITVFPSIINAVVCTSAFSCGSACIFLASRTMYGLAEDRQAPQIFLRTNRFGTPYIAVGFSLLLIFLAYMSLGSNSSVAFGWFVNITSVANLITWVVVEVSFLRFYYAMRAQGIDRRRLPYKSPLQPYIAWTTLIALVLVVLFSGYSLFFPGQWSTSAFLVFYIDIAIFIFLWVCSWLIFRKRPLKLFEIDLTEIDRIEAEEKPIEDEPELRSWWRRYII